MTSTFSRIGVDDVSERALLLLDADTSADLPVQIVVGSKYFVALLAWDVRAVETAEIAHVARILLDAGCVYFCCWGPGCERVHDIIDEEYIGNGTSVHEDDSTIMTTWHTEESLEEAAWFALNLAFPDDRFFDGCKAVLSVCIGNPGWKAALEQALANTRALAARVVAEDSPPPNTSLERMRDK
jgi:hypothetical protein